MVFWSQLLPILGALDLLCLETCFVVRELFDKADSYFEVWSAWVNKLKCFKQRPFELAHEVAGDHWTCPRLTSDWVNQYGFPQLLCGVYKIEYLTGYFILLVKQYLVFGVVPVEGQIHHTDVLPKISKLPASAINYASDFICENEFQVLYYLWGKLT